MKPASSLEAARFWVLLHLVNALLFAFAFAFKLSFFFGAAFELSFFFGAAFGALLVFGAVAALVLALAAALGWGGVRGCDKRSVGASTDASDS